VRPDFILLLPIAALAHPSPQVSVGIEAIGDIIADFEASLKNAFA
jgi:O-acetylhomoserine/O-acetylserine sulfhydrylase-like pyridoxal-dependent enzyme